MKLKFKINKCYLLVHSLNQLVLPFEEWVNLQNRLWEKYQKAYYSITHHPEVAFVQNEPFQGFDITAEEMKKLVKDGLESKEFNALLKEAEKYFTELKKQWEANRKKAVAILTELSGLNFPNDEITVLITHPSYCKGFSMPSDKIISIGYLEDWKNASISYLCHEIMHLYTLNTPIMHALIQLMTDNELRIRLNNEGKYFIFEELPKNNSSYLYQYFGKLRELERKIYPYWQDYLKDRKGRTIQDLEQEIKLKLK